MARSNKTSSKNKVQSAKHASSMIREKNRGKKGKNQSFSKNSRFND